MKDPGRFAALAVGALLALGGTMIGGFQIVEWTSGRVEHVDHRVFPEGVERIRAHVGNGDIQLTGTAGAEVEVEARLGGRISVPELRAKQADGLLDVWIACGGPFWSCSADIEIRVPSGVPVEVRTSAGDIKALDLESPARLRSGAGDIRVEGASGGELTMSTAAGDVRATDIGAPLVDADSASGDVLVELSAMPDDVDASSSSGDVRITVPDDGAAYNADVRTGSGDTRVGVRTDPLSPHRLRASTGSGDVSIGYAGRN